MAVLGGLRFLMGEVTLYSIFFLIILKPKVECYTKSMSLKYEPASEPLYMSVK